MEKLIYLMIPLGIFGFCLTTLRVIIYWKMLKQETAFDYLIVVSYYIFSIAQFPMKLSDDFPEPQILALSKRYDKLLLYFYLIAFVTMSIVIIDMASEFRKEHP